MDSFWLHSRSSLGNFCHHETSACRDQAETVPSLVSTQDSSVFPEVFEGRPLLPQSAPPSLGPEGELACGRPALRVALGGEQCPAPRARGWECEGSRDAVRRAVLGPNTLSTLAHSTSQGGQAGPFFRVLGDSEAWHDPRTNLVPSW